VPVRVTAPNVCRPVKVWAASVRAIVALVVGKVSVVPSVPANVNELLTVRVLVAVTLSPTTEVAPIVPVPLTPRDAPVPTTMAALVLVEPVMALNAVAALPEQAPHAGTPPLVSTKHSVPAPPVAVDWSCPLEFTYTPPLVAGLRTNPPTGNCVIWA